MGINNKSPEQLVEEFDWELNALKFIIDEDIYIEKRYQRDGSLKYIIRCESGYVLDKNSLWQWELQPSSRTDEHLAATRFDTKEEALLAYYTRLERERNGQND